MKNKCYIIYHQDTDQLVSYIGYDLCGTVNIFDNDFEFVTYGIDFLPYFGWEVVTEL